ncbi:alcohol dehydrogenase groES-like domain-containing protein [Rhizoctonia solani AG-1 IA]|uniref:Alcohol dehydrogenase groES-like domain-containing protein n=1 Tax=Thanatephorus cucumeris (strain AG1-IA) TaxID=983506 RepID=L8WVD9_THACA|nr:alcohol dehydrogenase groES-like domain-containing protein [Rhizoctonia solani AG-1 IA]
MAADVRDPGFVVAVGKGTSAPIKVGQAVGIKWLATSCLSCEACARGKNESVCPDAQCSGYTVDGSFQQYAVSYAAHVTPIPECMRYPIALDLAAPILCAGVTVFKAIKQAGTQPGDIIVISGAGGGLAPTAGNRPPCHPVCDKRLWIASYCFRYG